MVSCIVLLIAFSIVFPSVCGRNRPDPFLGHDPSLEKHWCKAHLLLSASECGCHCCWPNRGILSCEVTVCVCVCVCLCVRVWSQPHVLLARGAAHWFWAWLIESQGDQNERMWQSWSWKQLSDLWHILQARLSVYLSLCLPACVHK